MARVKLTEHKAKTLLYNFLKMPYSGIAFRVGDNLPQLSEKMYYVVKVDQGVKKRGKQGLIKLKVSAKGGSSFGRKSVNLETAIDELKKKGYEQFIIEEMVEHEQKDERYLAMERTREGWLVSYSKNGGVDIEEHAQEIKRVILNDKLRITNKKIERELDLPAGFITQLREFCEKYYVSFMEINPLVVINHPLRRNVGDPSLVRRGVKRTENLLLNKEEYPERAQARRSGEVVYILDLAVEVDSTAQFFVDGHWTEADIVTAQHKTPQEQAVDTLNKKSQAAFSLTLLNPNGSIWVLLSGGGASLTIADEVHNLGFGRELGNYGEYSGNPNEEETYLYTRQVLDLMMGSNRRRLMLIIGGGVANFTDIRITFKGIIKALEEYKKKFQKKQIKIFVRRGGPHQEKGLKTIEEWLKDNKINGLVSGPEMPLNEIVSEVIHYAKH